MAGLTPAILTAPVSNEDPCGADLDLAGDPDFLNFLARAEGLLPSSYFSGPEGRPFDRSTIDFEAELAAVQPLVARTRDIRLLVLLAKFSVLSRDLNAFAACIGAIAQLLEDRWDDVHPRSEAGSFAVRAAVLETLNDSAPVLIPLQYAPLVHSKRFGAVSYRNLMFASGEATPRESEQVIDAPNLDRAFMEAELPALIETRATFASLKTAFETIEKCCGAKASDAAVSLEKVIALVDKIFTTLNDIVAKRDPGAAAAPASADGQDRSADAAGASAAAGSIRSYADVLSALAAIDAYFCRCEPSNPALLLVRQVRQLAGKSLLDVLQVLMPSQISEVKFRLGGSQSVDIPLENLASLATIDTPDINGGEPGESEPAEGSPAPNAPPKLESRQEAFALLEQIAAYYRVAEPSSPISLILDRARGFANRDFLSILKDLLPKSTAD
jgi:type VI secretion system protein ImpA